MASATGDGQCRCRLDAAPRCWHKQSEITGMPGIRSLTSRRNGPYRGEPLIPAANVRTAANTPAHRIAFFPDSQVDFALNRYRALFTSTYSDWCWFWRQFSNSAFAAFLRQTPQIPACRSCVTSLVVGRATARRPVLAACRSAHGQEEYKRFHTQEWRSCLVG